MKFKTLLKQVALCVPFALGSAGLITGGAIAFSGTIIRDRANLEISHYIYINEISDMVRDDAEKLFEQFQAQKISGDKYLDQLRENRINAAREYYAEDADFQAALKDYEKGLKFVDGGVAALFSGLALGCLGAAPMVYSGDIARKTSRPETKIDKKQETTEETKKQEEQENSEAEK